MNMTREKISKALEAPRKEKGWEGFTSDSEFGPATNSHESLARLAKDATNLLEKLRIQENAGDDTAEITQHIEQLAQKIDQAYAAREARLQKLEDELRGIYPSLDATGLRDKASALDVLQQTQKAGEENGQKYNAFDEDIRTWKKNNAWNLDKATDEDLVRLTEKLNGLHFIETEKSLALPYPAGEEKMMTSADGMTRFSDPKNKGNTPSERLMQWKNLCDLANEIRIEGGRRGNEITKAFFGEKVIDTNKKPEETSARIEKKIKNIRNNTPSPEDFSSEIL